MHLLCNLPGARKCNNRAKAPVPQRANIDLHSPTSGELAVPQPVEALPRALLAPELVAMREVGGAQERVVRVS